MFIDKLRWMPFIAHMPNVRGREAAGGEPAALFPVQSWSNWHICKSEKGRSQEPGLQDKPKEPHGAP